MSQINTFNSENFGVVFSNIPIPTTSTTKIKPGVLNNYVRGVTLPDYNLEVTPSNFGRRQRSQPVSRINNELTQLTIDFAVDEDLDNYYALVNWIVEIRNGRPTKHDQYLHDSTIKSIIIIAKDNQKRDRQLFTFKDCMLVNISALTLRHGSSQEVEFSCTFTYYDFELTESATITYN